METASFCQLKRDKKGVFMSISYDFNQKCVNGRDVYYATLPNFALEIVESHPKLTNAAKLIYARALRWASYIKTTEYNFSHAWFVQKLSLDRKTVAKAIEQLKSFGYFSDTGIILPSPRESDYRLTTFQKSDQQKTENLTKQNSNEVISQEKQIDQSSLEDIKGTLELINLVSEKQKSLHINRLKEMGFDYQAYQYALTKNNDMTIEQFLGLDPSLLCPKIPTSCPKNTHHNNHSSNNKKEITNIKTEPNYSTKPISNLDAFIKGALAKTKLVGGSVNAMVSEIKCAIHYALLKGQTNKRLIVNSIIKRINEDSYQCRFV